METPQSNKDCEFEVNVLEDADNPKGYVDILRNGVIVRISTTRLLFKCKGKNCIEKKMEET